MDTQRAADVLALALAGDVARLQRMLGAAGEPALDGQSDIVGGVTPLMAAASGGHEAVVELLLRCGADPSRRDAQGRSAAAYARASRHPHLAERLDIVVDKEKTIW